jgi:hypothetical protein
MDDGHNTREVACEVTIPPIFIVTFHYYVFTTSRALCTMVSHFHLAILNCERHCEYRFSHKGTSFERVTNRIITVN